MRRLWFRWALLIVFVAVLGVVFVNLGEWQLDRLDQRKARNSTTLTNESRPVRPFTEVFTGQIRDADQWQRVEARGTYDAEHQFVLRYRRNGDADGLRGGHPAADRGRGRAGGPRLRGLDGGSRIPGVARRHPAARSPWSDMFGATSRAGEPRSRRSPARCG